MSVRLLQGGGTRLLQGGGNRLLQGTVAPVPPAPPAQVSGGGVAVTLLDWLRKKEERRRRTIVLRPEPGRLKLPRETAVTCGPGRLSLRGVAPVTVVGTTVICEPGVARWYNRVMAEKMLRRRMEEEFLLLSD